MKHKKEEIITFKVDSRLHEILYRMSNRSAFIRSAILNALENMCPLCNGTGVLTPAQKNHMGEFMRTHSFVECGDCTAVHIVCDAERS
ncbi:CopG family transcriptional regulator [bacterium]|nr:CopG family transcriptional regulator [candidate division CSSED10-310 bacterium]